MLPTPHPSTHAFLTALLRRQQDVLGDDLIGLYLYGSAVVGDFAPGLSDLDLLAVLPGAIDAARFAALLALHDGLAADFPAWRNRIEVQYVPAAALRTFKTQTGPIAVISPGEPLNIKPAGIDWLLNWYFVRQDGLTLHGPDPHTLIPDISHAEFLAASHRDAQVWTGWAEQPHDARAQSYAVLTLCRALYAAETADRASKPAAARYVGARYPQWAALIDDALRWRQAADRELGDGRASWPRTAEFVGFVMGRLG
jgi:hypothetical protein